MTTKTDFHAIQELREKYAPKVRGIVSGEEAKAIYEVLEYVSFEVYRPVKSPTEKGEYMGKTPNLEQARRAADAVGGALYGITSDGRKVLLL